MPPVGQLVDAAVLRSGRVGADRRCVDERRHARRGSRLEDATRALDVDAARHVAIVGRLDQPREVDDDVRAAKRFGEVVARDVGADPARALERQAGPAARDPDDLVDGVVGAERGEQARPDVAGRAGDRDPHQAAAGGGVRCWSGSALRRPPVDLIARTALAIAACIARRCAAGLRDGMPRSPASARRGSEPEAVGWITAREYPQARGSNTSSPKGREYASTLRTCRARASLVRRGHDRRGRGRAVSDRGHDGVECG